MDTARVNGPQGGGLRPWRCGCLRSTLDGMNGKGDLGAQVRETHTGVVVLLGGRAYKAKKPVVTDFLDFSTTAQRELACQHEVTLNRRLAPGSYLGVAHLSDPQGGPPEPVIVMRRYADTTRLASLVKSGVPVSEHLATIATVLARFHSVAERGPAIEAQGSADAVWARWRQNLRELKSYANEVVTSDALREAIRMAGQFVAGRQALFAQRIADRHILDGHADLLADDIFCVPTGPALLDDLFLPGRRERRPPYTSGDAAWSHPQRETCSASATGF